MRGTVLTFLGTAALLLGGCGSEPLKVEKSGSLSTTKNPASTYTDPTQWEYPDPEVPETTQGLTTSYTAKVLVEKHLTNHDNTAAAHLQLLSNGVITYQKCAPGGKCEGPKAVNVVDMMRLWPALREFLYYGRPTPQPIPKVKPFTSVSFIGRVAAGDLDLAGRSVSLSYTVPEAGAHILVFTGSTVPDYMPPTVQYWVNGPDGRTLGTPGQILLEALDNSHIYGPKQAPLECLKPGKTTPFASCEELARPDEKVMYSLEPDANFFISIVE